MNKHEFDHSYPAIVIGMFETGLGVARTLGRAGIRVIGIDYKKDIGFLSKFVEGIILPDPKIDGGTPFIIKLVEIGKSLSKKAVIFITSDSFLQVIAENINIVKDIFHINIPNLELLTKIENKYEQYKLALNYNIPVPKTILITKSTKIQELVKELEFPCFIKGLDVKEWRRAFGGSKKGFVVYNMNEMMNVIHGIIEKNIQAIVQELIPGPDTKHFKTCSIYSAESKEIVSFTLQKIRQNPIHFGVGSVVQSIKNEELMSLGNVFLSSINYTGIGSIEFKFDERDNKFKIIELNPRFWQQNSLTEMCGCPFSLYYYYDLTNQLFNPNKDYKVGIKWVNIYMDFNSFVKYRKEGSITLAEWLNSLRGKKVFSDFAIDDPIPGLYELNISRLWRKLFKKVGPNV
ncbi:MAG: hypothetical protein FJ041_03715 [Candidatus Cloacimonetes bacterium]|nr:hypothetical protein [Candidatus Cloacimonadota bacterium]